MTGDRGEPESEAMLGGYPPDSCSGSPSAFLWWLDWRSADYRIGRWTRLAAQKAYRISVQALVEAAIEKAHVHVAGDVARLIGKANLPRGRETVRVVIVVGHGGDSTPVVLTVG